MISSISPINFTSKISPLANPVTKLLPIDTFQSQQAEYFYKYKECFQWENFSRIKLFDKFNSLEKKIFKTEVLLNMDQFFATALGYKPAFLSPQLHYVKKLTPLTNQLLDIVSYKSDKNKCVIMFNRNSVKELIGENKNIYIQLLNLDNKSSVDEIYNTLIHCQDLLAKEDLLGITLGFPIEDSLIFKLDNTLLNKGIDTIELRKNIEQYKKTLLEFLHSEQCPYQNDSLIKEIENSILKIQNIKPQVKLYLKYISFLDTDSQQTKNIDKYLQEFSIDKLI